MSGNAWIRDEKIRIIEESIKRHPRKGGRLRKARPRSVN